MKEKIKNYARVLKISDIGVCKARVFDELTDILDTTHTPFSAKTQKRISPFTLMENAKSIIMCVFNYYTGVRETNISKYAYGKDYHEVVQEKLEALCALIKKDIPSFEGYIFCDTSPMCDKYLAYLSGLGFIGKNHLLIHPKYGSYIVIGGIITNLDIKEDIPLEGSCADCGKCISSCPGGALISGGFDAKKCASYISQKKSELTNEEAAILKSCGSAWGCDICSDVCMHNKNAHLSDIEEFYAKTDGISEDDLADESTFVKNMKSRAFAWRGYDTIKRNFDLTKKL